MPDLPRRKHLEVLSELAAPQGRRLLDVGCGDGTLLRALMRRGARAGVGLEPSAAQLERARSGPPLDGLAFQQGQGEALPFAAASFDLVIFFNSLHHLPLSALERALAEAARVLDRGGLLYVAEPLAEGPSFELMRPIDDETHVRTVAYECLRAAGGGPYLHEVAEVYYDAPARYADFDDFRKRMEAVDGGRAAAFQEQEAALRAAFEQLGQPEGRERLFSQPMRVNLLRPAPRDGESRP